MYIYLKCFSIRSTACVCIMGPWMLTPHQLLKNKYKQNRRMNYLRSNWPTCYLIILIYTYIYSYWYIFELMDLLLIEIFTLRSNIAIWICSNCRGSSAWWGRNVSGRESGKMSSLRHRTDTGTDTTPFALPFIGGVVLAVPCRVPQNTNSYQGA